MKYDFHEWRVHFEAPANECPECGELRAYEAGSSNMRPCWNCGYGKPDDEEETQIGNN